MPMKIDRLTAIRQHLYAHGATPITALAIAVDASLATLRRDLAALESDGVIERIHGGARLAQGANIELAFEQRERTSFTEKRQIGALAFSLLRPNTTIFLDSGTTVLQLARRLRLEPLPLTAVTNGLPVATELMHVPSVQVIVLGGELRRENASIVGPHAEAQLDRMHFDQLFIGAGAIGDDATIYTMNLAEAALNARMLARSQQRVLLADAGKFGHLSSHVVAPLAGVTDLIVDAALPAPWRRRVGELGVRLRLAGA